MEMLIYEEGSQGCLPSSPVMRGVWFLFNLILILKWIPIFNDNAKHLSPDKGVEYV